MMQAPLDAALAYAKRGWFIFPIFETLGSSCACGNAKCEHPAKHPRTPNGCLNATANEVQVRKWWKHWPNASIGIATQPSGLVVLDVDPRHGGDESMHALAAECGELDTLVALSGGGGEHRYFRATIAIASRAEALGPRYPGIDVRAQGGYIIAPPSVHISGRSYQWEASSPEEPAALPAWLAASLQKPERGLIVAANDDALIAEGQRNDTLARVAGRFRRQGMTAQAIEDALLAMNARQCVPPLPKDEVGAIARSIARYPPEKNGAGGAIGKMEQPRRIVRLVPTSQIAPVETRYVVEPYVPRGEATWLEGLTKTGKTMVAIDLIARLTRGDVLPPTSARIERGRAVILTCEDSAERTIVPRLIAAEADLDRVTIIRVEEEGAERIPSFVYDGEAIERQLGASRADLLMVDGTFGVLGVEDGHSYTEAYQRMLPLVAMVRRLDIGAIIVRHIRKTEATALNRGIGSVGYASLARSTVSVAFDRDDETGARRLLAHAGSNVGATGPTLTFTVVGVAIEELTRAIGRVVWGDVVDVTADEAMREGRTLDDRSALDAACDLLHDVLADGPVRSLDVYAAADRVGIKRMTLRRAATKLLVERQRDGERGPWLMTLPESVPAQN
ncbi:MAG TPA: bifunctional DNA primase/polymerase [Candidatus Baltobacteraceae bacterium]|jgi:hypothetical protein|nr:bifunctional DNA primase/polymerase [Candidatus Baltobacteraceae bacterium]